MTYVCFIEYGHHEVIDEINDNWEYKVDKIVPNGIHLTAQEINRLIKAFLENYPDAEFIGHGTYDIYLEYDINRPNVPAVSFYAKRETAT